MIVIAEVTLSAHFVFVGHLTAEFEFIERLEHPAVSSL